MIIYLNQIIYQGIHSEGLIDLCGLVAIANNRMLSREVGAAKVAVRKQGATQVFNQINMLVFY